MQGKVAATPVAGWTCASAEVIDVHYTVETLVVLVQDGAGERQWRIEFPGVEGFRVLDEGDLMEFWPTCRNSVLVWEVTSGGWLEQECSRPGYVGKWTKNVREYFVAGENACISVISWTEPVVSPG